MELGQNLATLLACGAIDRKYRLIDCNIEAARLLEYDSRESLLLRYHEIITGAQPDGSDSGVLFRRKIDEAYESGQSVFPFSFHLASGRVFCVTVTLVCLELYGGKVLTVFFRDQTELCRVIDESESHKLLLESVNMVATKLMTAEPGTFDTAIWESLRIISHPVNADRVYIWENFTENEVLCCRQIYEWSENAEPQQGKSFAIFTPYDAIPNWKKKMESNRVSNGPLRTFPDDDERRLLEAQNIKSILLIPIYFSGKPWGYIGFDDCKTERYFSKIEEQVLRSAGMLMISAIIRNNMTENLLAERARAEESTRAKSEFLSRMSHEIRTPINAITGMTTLAKKSGDLLKIHHCLDMVEESSQQLLSIINDVLDMSKMDADKLKIVEREFDFEKLVRHVINVMRVKMDEKNLTFTLNIMHVFRKCLISDELRVSQILINLLSNAVKFTPPGGHITLSVTVAGNDSAQSLLRMEVSDTGIGIAPEKLELIFTSFTQGDSSTTRQYGGTGLGLAICRRLSELMNGKIWAESNSSGSGSKFIVELPVEWGGELRQSSEPLRPGLRILVADDSPTALAYMTKTLAVFSPECHTASDGAEAVRLVRAAADAGRNYDVILIDKYMPVLDGIGAIREIKPLVNDNAIVLVSGVDWSQNEREAAELGLRHFLSKPVLSSELYDVIRKIVCEPGNSITNSISGYDWKSKTLLMAEDIEINREIIIGMLEDSGIAIECASDGAEALAMFTAAPEKYDLILMDIQMPVLDGLSATRHIRASGLPGADKVPIVAMTANAFKEDEIAALGAGMNRYITKPVDMDELYRILSTLL